MIDQFVELQGKTGSRHHCGHYASMMRDFLVCDARGRPVPPPHFGVHPLGIWPGVIPFYSCTCPIVATYFAKINSAFANYLASNRMHLIGISFSIKTRDNGVNYYFALTFGTRNSADFVCSNHTCEDCLQSFKIDWYARALHTSPPQLV